jgi:hypothetical protein
MTETQTEQVDERVVVDYTEEDGAQNKVVIVKQEEL